MLSAPAAAVCKPLGVLRAFAFYAIEPDRYRVLTVH
jgi:hypothetical protein